MACAVAGHALQKKAYELVLNLKDGSQITYQLDERVVMTLDEQSVVLTRADFTAEYPLEEIDSFDQCEVEVDPESLERVSASNTQGAVVIYTLDGQELRRIAPDSEQQASFLLHDLKPGTYVISNGVSTYKIMKR